MNEEEEKHLTRFYSLLHHRLGKKIRNKSVLISFLRSRKVSRFNLLRRSATSSNFIPDFVLSSLLSNGLIQCIDNIDTYAITAKGVWYIEKNRGILDEEGLLSYIDSEYFALSTDRDLNEKEKAILFAMISARAFSEESSVDLKKDDTVKNKWKELLESSFDKLYELNRITRLRKDKFLRSSGNVHIVSSIFRHNNYMVQKTKGIYSYNGNQEYYLDLYSSSAFSEKKLSFLFWKVFKGDISKEAIDLILKHCNDVSDKESIYLYDLRKHTFSSPLYDITLRDCLMDSILSGNRWERI